jgi:hypothetical protein
MLVHYFWVFGFKSWFEFKLFACFKKRKIEIEIRKKRKQPP